MRNAKVDRFQPTYLRSYRAHLAKPLGNYLNKFVKYLSGITCVQFLVSRGYVNLFCFCKFSMNSYSGQILI